jgi:hypothetical protein
MRRMPCTQVKCQTRDQREDPSCEAAARVGHGVDRGSALGVEASFHFVHR